MKRTEIEGTGIVGVSIMLNHSEIVALKGFAASLKALYPGNKYDYVRDAVPLINSMIVFIEKMLPEEIMSIDEAYQGMFAVPVAVEPADNEL